MNEMKVMAPSELAFDIDGVVADTMDVFIRLAHERYGLHRLTIEDLACYNLYECLDIDHEILTELICLTLDDEHTLQLPPMKGAPEVLTQIATATPLHFVTARIWPESIVQWLRNTLPDVPEERIRVTATGDPDAKAEVLRNLGVKYFVEDRTETCRRLAEQGFRPILFDQPWNRNEPEADFPRVMNWNELSRWILP